MTTKGWYWQLEPAKTVLAKYSALKTLPPCPKCSSIIGYSKDSNGNSRNTHGCFKCKTCKLKLKAKDFWTEVLKLPLDALPAREFPQESSVIAPLPPSNFARFPTIESSPELLPEPLDLLSKLPRKRPANSTLYDQEYTTSLVPSSSSSAHYDAQIAELRKENAELRSQLQHITSLLERIAPQASSMAPQASTSTSPQASTSAHPPKKPTFAEVARKVAKTSEEVPKVHAAIRKCVGLKAPYMPYISTDAEAKHHVCRVYVQGLKHQPHKELKSALFDLRFQLSKIWSIDFIGKRIAEFTIEADYAKSFLAKVKSLPFLSIVPKVDPSKPQDPQATPEVAEAVKEAFTKRIMASLANSTRLEYKQFLTDLVKEIGISVEDSPTPSVNPTYEPVPQVQDNSDDEYIDVSDEEAGI
ncbi:hypothetical protein EV182_001286 [Spiromyces aspiralis]|uniref:Uncharacterized protein n=1 Tax=Spiromyces aspiralis TaxID=68401 RepID=A0ACC1HJX1_9FUNG|nr:hypothetical protein EV182_001286 [Spiromyces aspiralis]